MRVDPFLTNIIPHRMHCAYQLVEKQTKSNIYLQTLNVYLQPHFEFENMQFKRKRKPNGWHRQQTRSRNAPHLKTSSSIERKCLWNTNHSRCIQFRQLHRMYKMLSAMAEPQLSYIRSNQTRVVFTMA